MRGAARRGARRSGAEGTPVRPARRAGAKSRLLCDSQVPQTISAEHSLATSPLGPLEAPHLVLVPAPGRSLGSPSPNGAFWGGLFGLALAEPCASTPVRVGQILEP